MPDRKLYLTDAAIKAARASAKREGAPVTLTDTQVRGFQLRVLATGRATWCLRYQAANGAYRRFPLGHYPETSLVDARAKALAARSRVERGDDPQGERRAARKAGTFAELWDRYLEDYAKGAKRQWEEDDRAVKLDAIPVLGALLPRKIRRADILAVMDRVGRRGAHAQADRTKAALSGCFTWALERELVDFNPCHGIALRAPFNPRAKKTRALTEEGIRALWPLWLGEGTAMGDLFAMLLVTGQRSVEVRTMRWRDVDGDWWTVPPAVVKNKSEHLVYMGPLAKGILDRRARSNDAGGPFVFPSWKLDGAPIQALNKATDRYREASGIHEWSPHALRATVDTWMAKIGVPAEHRERVLNHSEASVEGRHYNAHDYEPEIRAALGAWNDALERILSGQPARVVELAHHPRFASGA